MGLGETKISQGRIRQGRPCEFRVPFALNRQRYRFPISHLVRRNRPLMWQIYNKKSAFFCKVVVYNCSLRIALSERECNRGIY